MMLNWKTTTLGQHARVTVTGPLENVGKMVPTFSQKSATVDARWTGAALEVFGYGSLWVEIQEKLAPSYPQVIDGVYSVGYREASLALGDFEAFVREMMRQPGWSVTEVPL